MIPIEYDVCILCLNYIKNDARALNLANSLTKLNKKVAVICLKDKENINFGFDLYSLDIANSIRLYKKMMFFAYMTFKDLKNIRSKYYLASELYSLPAARILHRRNGGMLVYESREIFSAIGETHNKPLRQMIFTKIESFLIKYVDSVIVSGNLDELYLKNIFPKHINYHIIMNVPFKKEIIKSDLLRKEFNINSNYKILLYQGMLMTGRGVEVAIKSMTYLDSCALVIMGNGGIEPNLKELTRELGLESRVFFKSFVPYVELHQWTCSADIGLVLFEPISDSYQLALPNKLFEYAMAGLPSISTKLPAIKEVINLDKFSYLIEYPFSPEELSNAVKNLSIPTTYEEYVLAAYIASQKYNYENQVQSIKKIFNIQ